MQFQKINLLVPSPLNFADVSIVFFFAKNQQFLAKTVPLLKAIGIRLPDSSKLVINRKKTITSQFADRTSSSTFFYVAVFLLSSLVTGPSFMSISCLVLELIIFVCKGLTRSPETRNTPV